MAEKRGSKEKLWVQTNGRNVFPPSLFLAEDFFSQVYLSRGIYLIAEIFYSAALKNWADKKAKPIS